MKEIIEFLTNHKHVSVKFKMKEDKLYIRMLHHRLCSQVDRMYNQDEINSLVNDPITTILENMYSEFENK